MSWTTKDASELYGIERWGDGYVQVSEAGTLCVSPDRQPGSTIDLKELVDRLSDRGLQLPILIRFNGILKDRLQFVNDCFSQAIKQMEYQNRYRCVFPIKVNQQREVVQQLAREGTALGCGMEAGSKPELLAAIAMTDPSTPIICNGFKDEEFMRLAMLAVRLGRLVIPVIEKASELPLVLKVARELDVRPTLGVRVKLATRGSGRWQASGGYRSKFGLTVAEVLEMLELLAKQDMTDCLQLLHFHVGSQISNIRQLKSAIMEASWIYADLKKRGAAMGYLDVGGGLGVDYDGTQSDTSSSMNYSVQEYANDVVYGVQSVCDQAGVPHPEILSESGRAVAAHHSVLVVETLGVTKHGDTELGPMPTRDDGEPGLPDEYAQSVRDLWFGLHELNQDNVMETFHDAQVAFDLSASLFSSGYLSLEQRSIAEKLYFAICRRVREMTREDADASTELESLDRILSDIYFVNFSLFQSLPDAWAINQLFPVVPIHRLDEAPTRQAVLGDITCDSDGMLNCFLDREGQSETLALHDACGREPYQLGVFLVGAYQEILGDLHNLFGDTHAVHIDCIDGKPKVRSVVKGDSVSEVLRYVQYEDRELIDRIQESVEEAISQKRITHQQAGETVAAFEKALGGYTYLSRSP